MKTPTKVLPLDPPATEAELDHAAEIWTAAQDVMVARGFGRELWGVRPASCHEFVVLMLRAEQLHPAHPGAPLFSQNTRDDRRRATDSAQPNGA